MIVLPIFLHSFRWINFFDLIVANHVKKRSGCWELCRLYVYEARSIINGTPLRNKNSAHGKFWREDSISKKKIKQVSWIEVQRQDRPWSKTACNKSSNQWLSWRFKKWQWRDVSERNLINVNHIGPNDRRCSVDRASNLAGSNSFRKCHWTCSASEILKPTDFYTMASDRSFLSSSSVNFSELLCRNYCELFSESEYW